MNVVDTSIVIAAFGAWHKDHTVAAAALRDRPRLPVHAAFEEYSVLTRLPPPHRAGPGIAREFLEAAFIEPLLQLPADLAVRLLGEMVVLGVSGGATYDALIGATARAVGATVLTLDHRARITYERLGVAVRILR